MDSDGTLIEKPSWWLSSMDIERPTTVEMEKFYARWRSGSGHQLDGTFVNKQASSNEITSSNNEITSVYLDTSKEITGSIPEPLGIASFAKQMIKNGNYILESELLGPSINAGKALASTKTSTSCVDHDDQQRQSTNNFSPSEMFELYNIARVYQVVHKPGTSPSIYLRRRLAQKHLYKQGQKLSRTLKEQREWLCDFEKNLANFWTMCAAVRDEVEVWYDDFDPESDSTEIGVGTGEILDDLVRKCWYWGENQ